MPSEPQPSRTVGKAAFAAATFAVSVVAIAALDRAGSPEGLIRALGPILALIAFGVFGIGRRAPPTSAALAIAALAAGAALCLGFRTAPLGDPIWPGAMVGFGLGAAGL